MKRLAVGGVVVVLLALGAGMFANLGTAMPVPVAHHLATAKPKVRPRPATLAVARGTATLAAARGTATPHALVPAAHHAVRHRPAATVQIVDPSSVTLPPVGPVLLLNPNTAAP